MLPQQTDPGMEGENKTKQIKTKQKKLTLVSVKKNSTVYNVNSS